MQFVLFYNFPKTRSQVTNYGLMGSIGIRSHNVLVMFICSGWRMTSVDFHLSNTAEIHCFNFSQSETI